MRMPQYAASPVSLSQKERNFFFPYGTFVITLDAGE